MKYIFLVVGGAVGTLLRYLISSHYGSVFSQTHFPTGTFIVNLSGAFIIGLLAGFQLGTILPVQYRLLIFAGFLGGFTTFSSYAIETMDLIRAGEYSIAVTYVVLSNILGIALAALGYFCASRLTV